MENEVFKKFEQVHDRYDMWLDAVRSMFASGKYTGEEKLALKMKALGGMLSDAEIGIVDLSVPAIPKEVPVLVGHTTKPWGENGFHVCEIGTPVYEFQSSYQIESRPIDESKPVKIVRFYKDRFDMLKPLEYAE